MNMSMNIFLSKKIYFNFGKLNLDNKYPNRNIKPIINENLRNIKCNETQYTYQYILF